MDMLPLLCAVAVAFTGLARGAGVLPDAHLNAAVGETVMFTTTVTLPETQVAIIRWKFGDKDITFFNLNNFTTPEYVSRITLFMSTGSLELRSLTLNDSGEYSISILPPGEKPMDGTTTLSVYERVSNVMVNANSTDLNQDFSVRLSCSSSGASLSFFWLNGSSQVTASDRVQLTDGGSTLTMNVTRYDQGPFSCRVSNPISNATSSQIHLSISYGPENINLEINPPLGNYEVGSDISLSCLADSRPDPDITWFLNGDLQTDTGPHLILMNIQESQSGNYSCRAFNSKTMTEVTSSPSAVSVMKKISGASITTETNLSIEGKSFNLSCDAAGSVFHREWRKGDVELTPEDNMQLYDKNRVLSFKSLSKEETGDYFCKVSNPISQEEAKYTLVVFYGPENVKIDGPNEIPCEDTLTLICSADSVPAAAFTWKLNGTKIHNSPVLKKPNINSSLSGNYTCEVFNHITGTTLSADHQLSVTERPNQSTCSDGCIAGIVIAVLAVCGGLCGGYYMYHTRKKRTTLSVRNHPSRTGAEGQDNKAYAGTQELNYADISFSQNKDGGTVQLASQSNSEYAQIGVNNNPPAASSSPTHDAQQQQIKKPAPQPPSDVAQLYAQVRKK
ncbi:carcinoembryonic antigen-related cell adhesion molecule 5 [Pseudoliparis swirei]|uniref:carcinoembryonic antigen-related cell adhesion molecule 5 n=1 Tax=Pseudoliparis swirei TaxID=2059687 RepID=UPI0024BDC232|nr:carcinoembryonic antigen-related cell adhesion molecule 5 [Pseudoliparis swirei]